MVKSCAVVVWPWADELNYQVFGVEILYFRKGGGDSKSKEGLTKRGWLGRPKCKERERWGYLERRDRIEIEHWTFDGIRVSRVGGRREVSVCRHEEGLYRRLFSNGLSSSILCFFGWVMIEKQPRNETQGNINPKRKKSRTKKIQIQI